MFKSTIQFTNGTTVQLECETATQLTEVLIGYDTGIVKAATLQPDTHLNRLETPSTKQRRTSRTRTHATWTASDIMLIVNKLQETQGSESKADIIASVQKFGQIKRTSTSIYVMINRIQKYMSGKKHTRTGIAAITLRILKENGILPGSYALTPVSPRVQPSKRRFNPIWTAHDLTGTINAVRDSLIQKWPSILPRVKEYLQKYGDHKSRPDHYLSPFISQMKRFFTTGEQTYLSKQVRQILKDQELTPFDQGNPVPITRIHTPQEHNLQEA